MIWILVRNSRAGVPRPLPRRSWGNLGASSPAVRATSIDSGSKRDLRTPTSCCPNERKSLSAKAYQRGNCTSKTSGRRSYFGFCGASRCPFRSIGGVPGSGRCVLSERCNILLPCASAVSACCISCVDTCFSRSSFRRTRVGRQEESTAVEAPGMMKAFGADAAVEKT